MSLGSEKLILIMLNTSGFPRKLKVGNKLDMIIHHHAKMVPGTSLNVLLFFFLGGGEG